MKTSIKIILLLSTLLLMFACFEPTQKDQFYPIHLNNNWKYERTTYYPYSDSISVDTIIVSINNIISCDTLTDSDIAIQGWRRGDYTSQYSELLFIDEEGLNYTGFSYNDTIGTSEPQLVYKYPVNISENWLVNEYNLSEDFPYHSSSYKKEFTCVAKDEIFITETDTFLTTVYHHCNLWAGFMYHSHIFEYFAYGIGKVGSESYYSEDTTYTFSERKSEDLRFSDYLIDYHLY